MSAWWVIALCGVGTYALRASMFVVVGRRRLPVALERAMGLVGPAAISALLAAMVLTSGGQVSPAPVAELVAVGAGFVVVRRTGNVVHAFAVGLPVVWGLAALGL